MMVANPEKQGSKNRKYIMDRRRKTKIPGYHGVLPRVFPYKKTVTKEEAFWVINTIQDHPDFEELVDSGGGGFALTKHPRTMDGHLTLWLSQQLADALIEGEFFSTVEETQLD